MNNFDKNIVLNGKYIVLNDNKLKISSSLINNDNIIYDYKLHSDQNELKIGDVLYVLDDNNGWIKGKVVQMNNNQLLYRASLNNGCYGSYNYIIYIKY